MEQMAMTLWKAALAGLLILWLPACAGDPNSAKSEEGQDREPAVAQRIAFSHLPKIKFLVQRTPLHERGVRSVAVVYKENGVVDARHDPEGFFAVPVYDEVPSAPLVSPGLAEGLLVRLINQGGFLGAQGYGETHGVLAEHFETSGFWGEYSYDSSRAADWVEDLGRRGHDTILLVKEFDIAEYAIGKKDVVGAKGLLSDETETLAYASFHAILIDIATNEVRNFGSYIQVSLAEIPGLRPKGGFETFSPDDLAVIAEALQARIENNVRQALLIFKMIPIRGQEFLTEADFPEGDAVKFEYPD